MPTSTNPFPNGGQDSGLEGGRGERVPSNITAAQFRTQPDHSHLHCVWSGSLTGGQEGSSLSFSTYPSIRELFLGKNLKFC